MAGVDDRLAEEAAAVRYALYDLEVDVIRASASGQQLRERLRVARLYLVTSPSPRLEAVVEAALEGGVRLVQYRAKDGSLASDGQPITDAVRLQQAQALRQLCSRYGALFLVNDRIDIALAVDADGVHLGQGDLPPALARQLLGPEKLVTATPTPWRSCSRRCAMAVIIGVGPVNATRTGTNVRQAAAESAIPFFAIGGIELANLQAVLDTGATQVAVVRAITEAADPAQAARDLLEMLQ